MNKEIFKIVNKVLTEEISGKVNHLKNKIFENEDMKKQVCSECGGKMMEGECMECGNMYENEIQELGGMDDGHPRFGKKRFPKKMSDDEIEKMLRGDDEVSFEDDDLENLKHIRKGLGRNRRDSELGESLKGNQKRIDKNKNNKIDSEDFRLLRKGKETETKEGKKFPDLSGDGKVTRKDVLLGRGVKLNGKKKETKENEMYELHLDESTGEKFIFTENDMIDIIENIVLEEKKKKPKKSDSAKSTTKNAQSKSKTENDKYVDSVVKKMKDYLKDGSKGEFETNPKHFPKGNGELGKMNKKAYIPSSAVEEYVENFTAAALENIDYDDIKPNEKWVEDNLVGSSRTGNNPKWANAVETEVGERRNKIRKDNLLGQIKKKAYNKAPQPVNDEAGENADKASKILMKLESVEDKKVITEIEKMKNLIGYSQKTQ